MKNNNKILIFGLFLSEFCHSSDFVNTMKGIGSNFKSFGDSVAAMGKGLGMGFGAPPKDYVYSYTVVNDLAIPIYVNTQELASFMGACFPKAGGWSQATVPPFTQNYHVSNKEYYFEMSLHANTSEPSNHLPYVNTDALYIQDCIQLPADKNSTKVNYFHIYMGKNIQYGQYVHVPKAEYMGYADPSNLEDKNATVVMSNVLTGSPALTLFNSTSEDLMIGYSSKTGVTSLQKGDCDLFFTMIEKNSFVYHSGVLDAATKKTSLPLGTVGIFGQSATTTADLFVMPAFVFGGKSYTLEIYQDNGQSRSMGLQALMSAHDIPSSRVRDLTPVPCVFWYQSVAQINKSDTTGLVDLPGQVWVISQGDDDIVSAKVPLGTAIQFNLVRPMIGRKRWIYFIYIDPADDVSVAKFISKFISGIIGADIITQYEQQGIKQFNEIQIQLSNILTFSPGQKDSVQGPKKIVVKESLLQAAITGALNVHHGQIQDSTLKVTGYLLGGDVFLSQGIGAGNTLYYQANPSQQTSANVPTSAVTNGYIMGITSAPKAMPPSTMYAANS